MDKVSKEDRQLFQNTVDSAHLPDKDRAKLTTSAKKQPPFCKYSVATRGSIGSSEVVNFAKNGICEKTSKKMRSGNINFTATIDLHGYKAREACEALADFIYQHQSEQFVHIIHGKGYQSENGISILKTQVVNFLKQHPQILACHSCPPKQGGTGAVFALLKKL
ncbi:MAG: hypothetical protein FXV80_03040 [Candidatus Thioglobus sp.]|nr:MAG: hypothetical protein FXV80_03040 [Candidatus Thioglobus sp.]